MVKHTKFHNRNPGPQSKISDPRHPRASACIRVLFPFHPRAFQVTTPQAAMEAVPLEHNAGGLCHRRGVQTPIRFTADHSYSYPCGQTGTISRILKRLHVHGLIKKVGTTYKYYLTRFGREVIAMALKLKEMVVIPQFAGTG